MTHKPLKYYKGNTLKQLRAFCAVARTGKMTDAADELFLSQSAIRSTNPADTRWKKITGPGDTTG